MGYHISIKLGYIKHKNRISFFFNQLWAHADIFLGLFLGKVNLLVTAVTFVIILKNFPRIIKIFAAPIDLFLAFTLALSGFKLQILSY